MDNPAEKQSQHHFLGMLPFEITVKIFSYLRQSDCLTCMTVCRQWYSTVPGYSRDIWRDILVSNGGNIQGYNQCWERCIGPHVKRVVFECFREEGQLLKAMQKLIDCGCDRIKQLEFYSSSTSTQGDFLPLLRQLVRSVTELGFCQHSSGLVLAPILAACPKLTHFFFKECNYGDTGFETETTIAVPQLEFTNLTHLSVELRQSDIQEQLVPLLQKCPNLQYLVYKHERDSANGNSDLLAAIYLDHIFSWCPKLVHLEFAPDNFFLYQDLPVECQHIKDDEIGLRCYQICGTNLSLLDEIGSHLGHNADTLEQLFLDRCGGDWSSVLRHLHLPTIRKLVLRNIKCDRESMQTMFSHCPSLEELVVSSDCGAPFNLPETLMNLPKLKRLDLAGIYLHHDGSSTTFSSLVGANILEQVSSSGSKVEHICLGRLRNFTNEMFEAIPRLITLKKLDIQFRRKAAHYSDDSFSKLTNGLRHTQIESLTLSGLQSQLSSAIRELGDLPFLQSLALWAHRYGITIDGTSLLYVLNNCSSLKKVNLVKVTLTEIGGDDPVTFLERHAHGFKVKNAVVTNDVYKRILLVRVQ